MSNDRSLLSVHFHSHGDVQFGPRSLRGGRETGSETESEPEEEAGSIAGVALLVLGVAVVVALARRRRRQRREEAAAPEQKNLDRWIPTR